MGRSTRSVYQPFPSILSIYLSIQLFAYLCILSTLSIITYSIYSLSLPIYLSI